jgi:hypothetical protein
MIQHGRLSGDLLLSWHLLDAIIIIIIMIIVVAVVIIVMIIIKSRIHTNTQPIFLFFSCRIKKKNPVTEFSTTTTIL